MPKIYALLVGINGYPVKPLRGCVHDVQSVRAYLESTYRPEQLSILELTDETARKPTRQGLIDAFGWFANATKEDTCLFYYSGHGSYAAAPADFANTNGWVQSFVCLDSRQAGGMDLLDKELAYLIWKTTAQTSGANFIAITDCCHAGTITKAMEQEDRGTERMYPAEPGHVPARAAACLGFSGWAGGRRAYREESTPDGTVRISVEQASHVHIAACGSSQTAKELAIGGKQQGAFTHALLQHLYACDGDIGYGNLLDQVAASVKNLVNDQQPLIHFNGGLVPAAGLPQRFLSQQAATSGAQYPVYRHARYGWCIRAGTIDQVFKGDRIIVQDRIESRVISSPEPNLSVIQNRLELESVSMPAWAVVERNPSPLALRISFAPALSEEIQQLLRDAFAQTRVRNVQLDEAGAGAYIVYADSQSRAYLALAGTTAPILGILPVQDLSAAHFFIEQISSVQNWHYLKTLDNPRTTLDADSYRIELFEADPDAPFDTQRWQSHDPTQQVIDLTYQEHGGVWKHPLVRIAVTNGTASTLWVTHAYLAFDFGIATHYFRVMEIPPSERHWLTFDSGGYVSELIGMQLEDRYVSLGYDHACEYIKLFLSTGEPIATHGLAQAGIARSEAENGMDKSGRSDGTPVVSVSRASWQAETLGFRIRGAVRS